MTDYDQEIHVAPLENSSGGWRAWRHVPPAWAELRTAGMPEVLGGAEGYPAFVEANGRTATEAVSELYKCLGQGFLAVEARRLRKIPLGAPPREISRTFEVTLEEAQAIIEAFVMPTSEDFAAREIDFTKLAPVRLLVEFAKEAEAQRQGKVP